MASRIRIMSLALSAILTGSSPAGAELIISEFLSNPSGSDSPREYVELVATQNIDFAATPYAVVFANNGSSTSDGWMEGGRRTYAFNINSGTVNRGDVVYVGGSLAAPIVGGGMILRTLDTGVVGGDSFGGASSGGVLGNGGSSADAIAVFDVGADFITSAMAPVDAIFFGDSIGSAFLSAAEGYMLPTNDHYAGGRLLSDSFLFADGGSGDVGILEGTFDISNDSWITGRTLSYSASSSSFGATSLSLGATAVPEPSTLVLALLCAIPAAAYAIRRRRKLVAG